MFCKGSEYDARSEELSIGTHHSLTGTLQIDSRGIQTPAFEGHIESALKIILPLEAAEVLAGRVALRHCLITGTFDI